MQLRRLNNAIHRDLGYLLTGVTILYAVSGVALNHAHDWDPNFVVNRCEVQTPAIAQAEVTREWVRNVLEPIGEKGNYRSHDFPTPNKLKIYLDEGSVFINMDTGKGTYENVERRPVFFRLNCLHVSPKDAWLVFSDFFAIGLVMLAITGLFILRGRKGIAGRGMVLAVVGMLVPLGFLISIQ